MIKKTLPSAHTLIKNANNTYTALFQQKLKQQNNPPVTKIRILTDQINRIKHSPVNLHGKFINYKLAQIQWKTLSLKSSIKHTPIKSTTPHTKNKHSQMTIDQIDKSIQNRQTVSKKLQFTSIENSKLTSTPRYHQINDLTPTNFKKQSKTETDHFFEPIEGASFFRNSSSNSDESTTNIMIKKYIELVSKEKEMLQIIEDEEYLDLLKEQKMTLDQVLQKFDQID